MEKLLWRDLLWSDNIWLENGKAWFVRGGIKALYEVDLTTNYCYLLSAIPEPEIFSYRAYSRCVKFQEKIFCIPYVGKNIWVYDLNGNKWNKILIKNPNDSDILIAEFWKCDEILWCVSRGLKQLIKVDMEHMSVDQYWTITSDHDETLARSVKFEDNIFTLSSNANRIYKFNTFSKQMEIYELPKIENRLQTISYDGNKFWLSGWKRAIYLWDKDENTLHVIDDFPEELGSYRIDGKKEKFIDNATYPFFMDSIQIGEKIFFLPSTMNQILYVDMETAAEHILDIENENETPEEVEKHMLAHKYLLEYVRDDRYLGIYSQKNQSLFELDTINMNIVDWKIHNDNESSELEKLTILSLVYKISENEAENNAPYKEEQLRIGQRIYDSIKEGL